MALRLFIYSARIMSIGTALEFIGLYRPLKKTLRYLTDTQYLRNELEVRADLRCTRKAVGNWAAQGAEYANPNRLFAVVSFTNLPMHAKFHCLAAKAMQLRGYTPLIFTHSSSRFAHKYFRMFGIDRLVIWDEYVKQVVSPDEVQVLEEQLLPSTQDVPTIMKVKFHGVEIGKHALSMTARRRVQGRLDLSDPQTWALFQKEFYRAVESVLAAGRFFDQNPVEKMLVRDLGYTPNGAIYETALLLGTDCVVYEQGQRRHTWILKRYTPETKGKHFFSLSDATWEKVKQQPWTSEDDARLEREFAGRYKPDSEDDTRRLMYGKRIKPPEEVRAQLGLDPSKKTAVIFSHVAWDAAFFYGTCLFDDFESWLYETVKFVASECPQLNWIVKLHPLNAFKLQREIVREESEIRLLRTLMPLPEHIKIMRADTDINTQSLFPLVDFVLTVNGTVGMEFPCYGIPAIVAGSGRYEGQGFTMDARTRDEYFSILKNLHDIPRLDAEARRLARKHFYTLVTRRQFSLEDVAPMELKRFHEAQSNVHDNIHFVARSLEEFKISPSASLLGEWLAHSREPDLLVPLS